MFRTSASILLVGVLGFFLGTHPVAVQAGDFPVYVTPAITNDVLLPTSVPSSGYLSEVISLFASPGEYEPASFSIRAPQDLQDVTIQISDLTSGGTTIPASAVDIDVVKVWYQGGHPNRPGDVKYLTPELLVKDDSFVTVDPVNEVNILKDPTGPIDTPTLQPVDISANTLKQFWMTVQVPDATAAGNYTGTVQINAAGGMTTTMDLQVEVLPIQLQQPMIDSMLYHGASRLDPADVGQTTTGTYILMKSEEQFRAELEGMKAHGITMPMLAQDLVQNPDGSYDLTLVDRAMELIQDVGFERPSLLYIPYGYVGVGAQETPEEINEMKTWVSQIVALGQSYGFNDIYFYGKDEAGGAALEAERDAWIGAQEVGGKIYATAYTSFGDWYSLVGDILDLGIEGTAPIATNIDDMHAQGNELFCMRNTPVNGPIQGLTTRANYGVGMYLAGYDGSCDFAYQFAHGNIYDDTDWQNWDYAYTYPTVDGVLDTVQFEAWREATDDVRYLTTLLSAIEQGKAQGGSHEVLALAAEGWVANLRSGVDPVAYYAPGNNWYDLDPRINFAGRSMQDIRREMVDNILMIQAGRGKIAKFTDTFENFTTGASVSGQGEWYTYANPGNSVVGNQAGIAYEGQKYLDVFGEDTAPYRLTETPLGAFSELSHLFRMGDLYGGAGAGDAYIRFSWSGGHYPPGTLARTGVFDTGALCYFEGTDAILTGASLALDEWYEFSYIYDLAAGEIRWVVTRASDETVILDMPFELFDMSPGVDWSWAAEWEFYSDLPGASFHAYFDNFSISDVYMPAAVAGDANGDGMVTDADFTVWADTYGSTYILSADWNRDGIVSDADYTLWADNYGTGMPSVAVPEPATLVLLAIGAMAVTKRRCR